MPWFDHQKNFDLYKFGQLYINKLITNAKLQKFQQIDQRKISESAPKFKKSKKWTDFAMGPGVEHLGHLPYAVIKLLDWPAV